MMEAFTLFKKHIVFIGIVCVVCYLPYSLCDSLIRMLGEDPIIVLFGSILFAEIIVCNASRSLCAGSLVVLLLDEKRNASVSGRVAFREALRKWPSIYWEVLKADIIVSLGFLVLIIPGIYLFIRYSLLIPIMVAEGALKGNPRVRSAQLVAGKEWEILGILALFSIIGFPLVIFADSLIPATYSFSYGFLFLLCSLFVSFLELFLDVVFFVYYWNAVSGRKQGQEMPNDILSYEVTPPDGVSE